MMTTLTLSISKNFSFRCHRDESKNVFSVNAINFHPTHGTFSTAGSDGTVSFWDKDSKQRLKPFSSVNGTIPCTAFNRNGAIFAYAVSYDWSKVRKKSFSLNGILVADTMMMRFRDTSMQHPRIPTKCSCMLYEKRMSSRAMAENDK